ncbi:MAG: glutamine synthetase family protein [Alphaproteobacteria bacterium]|nr:glutamine synthetase family protein [Alphaproteobacteria bacterium]
MNKAGTGRAGFVARHGLRDAEAEARAAEIIARDADGLEVVRLSFVDQHGVLRGKTVMIAQLETALAEGWTITTTLLAKDPSHRTVYPVFTPGGGFDMDQMSGAGDVVMVPDPASFRILPWTQATGWLLCDIYFPDGTPVPFSTRAVLRDRLAALAEAGYDYVAGLEVEFHIFRLADPKLDPQDGGQPGTPPDVGLLAHGYQYLTETRADELDPVLEILRRDLACLGLPLRSVEVEFGPSQVEFTFEPLPGMEAADTMALFRSATKQICRRHGFIASFMCRPALPNVFSSGWHLHQSLTNRKSGANVFVAPADSSDFLSETGRQFVAGLVANARAASVFTTPTINGYKRFRPYSLAPDRAVWAANNKGVMIRAVGAGAGDPATHIENRAGEPAANPYLYMASQIVAGMDGITRDLEAGAPTDAPYDAPGEPLPKTLKEAVAALAGSSLFRAAFTDRFVDYIVALKEAEIARFEAEVTDWEHREYFENL